MTQTIKPVKRETLSSVRSRGRLLPIMVELNTTYLKVRLKGHRLPYCVTYNQLFTMGAHNQAAARAREKAARKKGGGQ